MAFNYSPRVVTSGLVLYLDATNTKSLADVPSQNLFTYSQDITTWSKLRATVSGTTSVTTAPDGTYTAQKLVEDTTTGVTHFFAKTPTISGTGSIYTVSMYAKAAERTWFAIQIAGEDPNYMTAYFDLTNGLLGSVATGITATMSNSGNGWYRCSITRLKQGTASSTIGGAFCISTSNLGFSYNGDGTSGIYLWGAQLELGSVATTYIPTTSAVASRVPTWTDLSRGGNNGTLVNNPTYNYSNGGGIILTNASGASGSNVTQRVIVSNSSSLQFTTGMSADIWFYVNGSTQPSTLPRLMEKNDFYILIFQSLPSSLSFNVASVAGGRSISAVNSPITNTTRINATTTYDGQLSKIYINGVLNNTTDFGSISPISPTSTDLSIGDNFGWNRTFNGTIYSTKLYNRALSAAEVLQNFNATKTRFGL